MASDPNPAEILRRRGKIPLWIKIAYTLFACVVVPVYWHEFGAKQFLWFSDIALFMTVAALWLENPLLNSMVAVGVLPMELLWNLDFFGRILLGGPFLNLIEYMFDQETPLFIRSLSLFHVLLPPVVILMLIRTGYDRRAFAAQTALALAVIPVTYLLTGPEDNINWVYGPGTEPQNFLHPLLYLFLGTVFVLVFIMLPMHFLLKKLCKKPES